MSEQSTGRAAALYKQLCEPETPATESPGDRARSRRIDVVRKGGDRWGFGYEHLLWVYFNPSSALFLQLSTHTVKVEGRNLDTLYEQVLRQEVQHLEAEDDRYNLGSDGEATAITGIFVVQKSGPTDGIEELERFGFPSETNQPNREHRGSTSLFDEENGTVDHGRERTSAGTAEHAMMTHTTPVNPPEEREERELVPTDSPLAPFVSVNPGRMHGEPCFKGTRVPIKNLFDYLEGGEPLGSFLDGFPGISRDQATAVLRLASLGLLEGLRRL